MGLKKYLLFICVLVLIIMNNANSTSNIKIIQEKKIELQNLIKEYTKEYMKAESKDKKKYDLLYKKIRHFLNVLELPIYAEFISTDDFGTDGSLSTDFFSEFFSRLAKKFDKINEIESVLIKNKKNIFFFPEIVYLEVEFILDFGKKSIQNKDLKALFNAKRYLVNFINEYNRYYNIIRSPYITSKTENCMDNDESCLRYGIWAIQDNDEKTTTVVDQKSFYLTIKPKEDILIFNGHGKSKDLYLKNNRIKELRGMTVDNREISILLEDTYGWKTIRLPTWVQAEVKLTINSIYKGTKYNDLCISEIKNENWDKNKIYGQYLKELRIEN